VSPSSYKFSRVDHPSLVETAPHAAPQWTISETLSKHTSVRLNLVHAHLIWAAADQAPRAGFSFGFVVFYVILISVNHFWFHLPSFLHSLSSARLWIASDLKVFAKSWKEKNLKMKKEIEMKSDIAEKHLATGHDLIRNMLGGLAPHEIIDHLRTT